MVPFRSWRAVWLFTYYVVPPKEVADAHRTQWSHPRGLKIVNFWERCLRFGKCYKTKDFYRCVKGLGSDIGRKLMRETIMVCNGKKNGKGRREGILMVVFEKMVARSIQYQNGSTRPRWRFVDQTKVCQLGPSSTLILKKVWRLLGIYRLYSLPVNWTTNIWWV